MYSAIPLNQLSTQVYRNIVNELTFGYDLSILGTWKWKVSPCVDHWPDYDRIDYPQAELGNYLTDKYFTITLLDPCIDSSLDVASVGVDQGPCSASGGGGSTDTSGGDPVTPPVEVEIEVDGQTIVVIE